MKDKHLEVTEQPEDEIELIDLLEVIWKWKYLMVGGSLLFILVVGIASLPHPRLYRATMLINSGVSERDLDGSLKCLIEPKDIETLVKSGELDNRILNILKERNDNVNSQRSISFNAGVRGGSNLVEISYDTKSPHFGNKVLMILYKLLQKEYSERYEVSLKNHENKEAALSKKIGDLKIQLKIKSQKLNSIRSRKKTKNYSRKLLIIEKKMSIHRERIDELKKRAMEIENEIKIVNGETDVLINKKQQILTRHDQNIDLLAALVFSNTVQLMREHLNNLNNQVMSTNRTIQQELIEIYNLEDEVEDVKVKEKVFMDLMNSQKITLTEDIKNIKDEINFKEKDLVQLQQQKNDINNIQLIQNPSSRKIPTKTLHNVILAGVLGLFFMVILSLFIEYLSKNKQRLESSHRAK